ncbi:hypothetical protein D915_007172 [Fasciola hepatica]|uniref:Uncharacterized protein n=1 Tax=Fasciola hepatica TaxID=6192 RepID=A0A2H1C3R7_FASHE|nr:hypothetical protein D915_007172 [Fasciola hepatica]
MTQCYLLFFNSGLLCPIDAPSLRSFVHIGVNSVLKRLERLDNIVRCDSEQEDPSICCVLLDVGWVKSQLGHHVAHLCAIREVRLVVLRPMQSLAKLTSSSLYPLKKSIAVGISLSNTAPLELRQWIEQVREVVPALTLPMVRPTAPTLPSQPLKRDNPERTDQLHMQSWDSYSVNCAKLYLPSETPISSDRIVTVAELWCRLCSSAKKIGSLQAGAEFFPLLSGSDAHQIPSFGATLVRTVPAQTEEQRHKRKTKKRRLDSSRPPIDSSKKLKKNKEKKSKCKH